jgi:DNA-binding FadR family transcriptional regulator
MFEPLEHRPSAVDAAEQAIREAVLSGRLPPGERLPPERRLAEQLGLSRLTLRAALARLAAAGLLSVRQGSGYLVCDYRQHGGPDLLGGLARLAERKGDLASVAAELLQVRRHLARAVLEKLAATGRGCPAAFVRAVDELERRARAGAKPAALAEADVAVVAALLDATGSPVLRLFLNPVTRALAELPSLTAAIYADPTTNVAAWRVLAAWLMDRPEAAIPRLVDTLAAHDEASLRRLGRRRGRRGGRRHR